MKFPKSHAKSFAKAVTYRMTSSTATFLATFALTGKASFAAGVVAVEMFAKPMMYFAHERVWETKTVAGVFTTTEMETSNV